MTAVQIRSVADPFRSDRTTATAAIRLLGRAEFVGCLPDGTVDALNPDTVRAVANCMAALGLPAGLDLLDDAASTNWAAAVAAMNDQLEMSPLPNGEWRPVLAVLGEDLLAELLGVSISSVRRYSAGGRSTPQAVAERLHFLALLLADLAGSYNDYGIRRWFGRPREALGGCRPSELLGADFDVDGADADALRALASRLLGAGAAA